jgi:pumilio family protein 6
MFQELVFFQWMLLFYCDARLTSLVDLLSGEHPSKKSAVLEHMTLALQPILEKGIVDHSIVHRALLEYMCIANKSSVTDIIQQLSGLLLV